MLLAIVPGQTVLVGQRLIVNWLGLAERDLGEVIEIRDGGIRVKEDTENSIWVVYQDILRLV